MIGIGAIILEENELRYFKTMSICAAIMWPLISWIMSRVDPPDHDSRWYWNGHNDIAIVFVHGLHSDLDRAWRANSSAYWPQIVHHDQELDSADIFLANYYTSLSAKYFDIDAIVTNLESDLDYHKVWDRKAVIFVCHSMGGIAVRKLLCRKPDLRHRKIGLLLYASPTFGSRVAAMMHGAARLVEHRQAMQLKQGAYLKNIYDEFERYKGSNKNLRGAEFAETKPYRNLPMRMVQPILTVLPEEAIGHFADSYLSGALGNCDHSNIVKPSNAKADSHRRLAVLYRHWREEWSLLE